jgi:hypothetical protein
MAAPAALAAAQRALSAVGGSKARGWLHQQQLCVMLSAMEQPGGRGCGYS